MVNERSPRRSWRGSGAVVLALASVWSSGARAGAEEAPGAGPPLELSVFLEEARAGRWEHARLAWAALEARGEAPERLACLAAEVHLAAGHPGSAAQLLRSSLGAATPRLDALYLAARIELRAGRPEGAREALLRAAGTGQAVLHDLGRDPELGPLTREPELALALTETARQVPLPPVLRDPFARGLPAPPARPPAPSLAGLRAALREARERAEARDLDGLDRALGALRREVEAAETRARGSAEAVYAEAASELVALGERAHALRLQLLLGRGNRLLQDLAEQAQAADEAAASVSYAALRELCQAPSERALLRDTQRRLLVRGTALWEEARLRAEVGRLALPLTGVALPDPSDPAPRRAIVADRIVAEGQELELPGASEPVKVLRIEPGAVTLSYRGLSFVRRPAPAPTQSPAP